RPPRPSTPVSLFLAPPPPPPYPLSLHDALPISPPRENIMSKHTRSMGGVLGTAAILLSSTAWVQAADISFLTHWSPETVAQLERSEEHTSELQSRENLVCRLLLEKKKPNPRTNS